MQFKLLQVFSHLHDLDLRYHLRYSYIFLSMFVQNVFISCRRASMLWLLNMLEFMILLSFGEILVYNKSLFNIVDFELLVAL